MAGAVGVSVLPFGVLALALTAGWISAPAAAIGGLVAAFALAILVARWLGRYLERRMRQGASLLQAIREGDYSVHAPLEDQGGLRELFAEINRLSMELSGVRQSGIESDALLGRLLGHIELAVLVFDPSGRLSGLNRAAGSLLGEPISDLRGRSAKTLGLDDWLQHSGQVFIASRSFARGAGPWEVRVLKFRRGGRTHTLLVMTDASRSLREEERRAWRRLIRVLGHELNNSLGSIASVADTLQRQVAPRGEGSQVLREGLELIERRTRNLTDFLKRYREYARMPPPSFTAVDLAPLVRHVAVMEGASKPRVLDGPDVTIQADRAQVEQALINLVRNALEATTQPTGSVHMSWSETPEKVIIEIVDDGPGLPQTDNLFVPFFTTKPGGSGIGLLVAREVAENHDGSLELCNREDQKGVIARLHLAKVPRGGAIREDRPS
ncbi:multi-sensor signal transduction histidine kinase [mine drainage metagenome]|uniref:histidine kinase n=1 Tax=mine drainage metagenome TaxID=410659 RepID=T1ADG0_9ZZZZ